jgi:hypothetical protein
MTQQAGAGYPVIRPLAAYWLSQLALVGTPDSGLKPAQVN